MGCACSIDGYDYDGPEVSSSTIRKARKVHKCCECWREIRPGEEYEIYKGKFGGDWDSYKTCIDCVSVRDALFCSWTCERVWETLHEELQEDPVPPSSSCMMAMTKPGRDRVCDELEEIWDEMEVNP